MIRNTIIAWLVIVSFIDLSASTPATVCKFYDCYSPWFQFGFECRIVFELRIRNRYRGFVIGNYCNSREIQTCDNSFINRMRCSSDGIFCIEFRRNGGGGFILRHGNLSRWIPGVAGRKSGADQWCMDARGTAFWMDL